MTDTTQADGEAMILTDFLLARIAEDEAAAAGAHQSAFEDGPGWVNTDVKENYDHLKRWKPDRVLAECEAKRRIVEAHAWVDYGDGTTTDCEDCWQRPPCLTLRLLSLPYADHFEYRGAWKP